VQRDDFAVGVGEHEQIAVIGLPGILTDVLDRGGIAIPHESQRSQQVRFPAKGDLMLVLHNLERQHSVECFLLDFPLHAPLCALTYDQQCGTRQTSSNQDKRQQKLGAESQIGMALQHV
jgi:hypothetical protein